jgi:hypothetical protein
MFNKGCYWGVQISMVTLLVWFTFEPNGSSVVLADRNNIPNAIATLLFFWVVISCAWDIGGSTYRRVILATAVLSPIILLPIAIAFGSSSAIGYMLAMIVNAAGLIIVVRCIEWFTNTISKWIISLSGRMK